jgi:hypothetical protein
MIALPSAAVGICGEMLRSLLFQVKPPLPPDPS